MIMDFLAGSGAVFWTAIIVLVFWDLVEQRSSNGRDVRSPDNTPEGLKQCADLNSRADQEANASARKIAAHAIPRRETVRSK